MASPPKTWVPLVTIGALVMLFVLLTHPWKPATVGEPRTSGTTSPPPPRKQPDGPAATTVFYLYDISRSMHTGAANSPFRRVLPLFGQIARALGTDQDVPGPQLHRVGVIGDASLKQNVLCDVRLSPQGIFITRDAAESVRQIEQCTSILGAQQPAQYTDISGGLKYAGLALEGSTGQLRAIVVFTDLEEDLAPGAESVTADLSGVCLAVYYEITGNSATTAHQLDERKQQWSNRLRSWHAKGSQFRLAAAYTLADLREFLLKCSRQPA